MTRRTQQSPQQERIIMADSAVDPGMVATFGESNRESTGVLPLTGDQSMDQKIMEYVAPLQALREQEQAKILHVRAQLHEFEENIKRLDRAISALTGEARSVGRPRKDEAAKPVKRSTNTWIPKQDVLDRIAQAVMDAEPKGITSPQVAENTGISYPSTKRAINVLRDQEIIRKAGKKGMADVYRAMKERETVDG
jgi:hypothetical protein